jgi:alpha,alpha-trehalose phosphorylase
VSERARLPVEPWRVREPELDLERMGQMESLFALANGHIGLRGNLDEGEPYDTPGTLLSGFYEEHPLPYPEDGYGNPESGQTLINVTSGKLIRLLVDDQPFDVRTGQLLRHERVLDLRAGTLRRDVEWVSPAGRTMRIRSTRLVSLTERSIVAIAYEVEPVSDDVRVLVQSDLVANEVPAEVENADPRVAEALDRPLVALSQAPASAVRCSCTGRLEAAWGRRRHGPRDPRPVGMGSREPDHRRCGEHHGPVQAARG